MNVIQKKGDRKDKKIKLFITMNAKIDTLTIQKYASIGSVLNH